MLGGSASGGSLRWNDPDRFHGYDLSRSGAAPQAVEPMMGMPAAFHKGAFGASAAARQRRISISISGSQARVLVRPTRLWRYTKGLAEVRGRGGRAADPVFASWSPEG